MKLRPAVLGDPCCRMPISQQLGLSCGPAIYTGNTDNVLDIQSFLSQEQLNVHTGQSYVIQVKQQ